MNSENLFIYMFYVLFLSIVVQTHLAFKVTRLIDGDLVEGVFQGNVSTRYKCEGQGTFYSRVNFEEAKCHVGFGDFLFENLHFSETSFSVYLGNKSNETEWLMPKSYLKTENRLQNMYLPFIASNFTKLTVIERFLFDHWVEQDIKPFYLTANGSKMENVLIKPEKVSTLNLEGELLRFKLQLGEKNYIFLIKFYGEKLHEQVEPIEPMKLQSYTTDLVKVSRSSSGDQFSFTGMDCTTYSAFKLENNSCQCSNSGTFLTILGIQRCYGFDEINSVFNKNFSQLLTVQNAGNIFFFQWKLNSSQLESVPLVNFNNIKLTNESCVSLFNQTNFIYKNGYIDSTNYSTLYITANISDGVYLQLIIDKEALQGQLLKGEFICRKNNRDLSFAYFIKFEGTREFQIQNTVPSSTKVSSTKMKVVVIASVVGIFAFLLVAIVPLLLYFRRRRRQEPIKTITAIRHLSKSAFSEPTSEERVKVLEVMEDKFRSKAKQSLLYVIPSILTSEKKPPVPLSPRPTKDHTPNLISYSTGLNNDLYEHQEDSYVLPQNENKIYDDDTYMSFRADDVYQSVNESPYDVSM